MQQVFGDAQSFVDLLSRARLDSIDLPRKLPVRAVGAEEVLQQENQFFIGPVGIVAIGIEAGSQVRQAFGEVGLDAMQGLNKFGCRSTIIGRVIEEPFFRKEHVLKNGSGKILLKEEGETVRAVAFMDAVRIVVGVIQDEELPGADGNVASFHLVPFFPGKDCLDRKTADVVIAANSGAKRVTDDVVTAELAEMSLFVKAGGAMVGQPGKILSIQI